MKKKSVFLYILIFLVLAAIIWLIFLSASSSEIDTVPVILPTEAVDGGNADPDRIEQNETHTIAVTPDTVQAVIRTLSRADNYSRTLTVESFWSGGSSSQTISVWNRGSSVKMTVSRADGSVSKNILIDNNKKWIWYSGSDEVFHGAAAETEADEYQTLLTYENVLELDKSAITDAGYIQYNEEMCIYVRYASGEFAYDNLCYISIATGLLMGSEIYDGDKLIYRMSSTVPDISTPDESVFSKP